jgi:hypothetical protein
MRKDKVVERGRGGGGGGGGGGQQVDALRLGQGTKGEGVVAVEVEGVGALEGINGSSAQLTRALSAESDIVLVNHAPCNCTFKPSTLNPKP